MKLPRENFSPVEKRRPFVADILSRFSCAFASPRFSGFFVFLGIGNSRDGTSHSRSQIYKTRFSCFFRMKTNGDYLSLSILLANFRKILALLPSRIFPIRSSLVLYLNAVPREEGGSQCEVKGRDLVRHLEKRHEERSIAAKVQDERSFTPWNLRAISYETQSRQFVLFLSYCSLGIIRTIAHGREREKQGQSG